MPNSETYLIDSAIRCSRSKKEITKLLFQTISLLENTIERVQDLEQQIDDINSKFYKEEDGEN